MSLGNDLRAEISGILKTNWKTRDGNVVPEASDVQLGNDAVKLQGAVLYADLADSSALVSGHKDWFAAEVYKTYLACACRIIRDNGGSITAFDGDRVMAVFIGDMPNTNAAKVALQINWAVREIVNPAIKKTYPDATYSVKHAVGIDTSELFVARTGIRGSNDLVWVGNAANLAAKMCSIRDANYPTFISEAGFKKLHDSAKLGGDPKRSMWNTYSWGGRTIYASGWTWGIA